MDSEYFRIACDLAFRLGQRKAEEDVLQGHHQDWHPELPVIAPEDNRSRLERHDAGDMTEFCFWCGLPYVNTGDFPYCSYPHAVLGKGVR